VRSRTPTASARAPTSAGVEEQARVGARLLDQLVRTTEVRGRDAQRAGRRQNDDPRVARQRCELVREARVNQQRRRVHQHGQRAAGRRVQLTRRTCRQDVDLVRAQFERMGERRVVGDAAVDQLTAGPVDRGQDARDRRAGHHRVDQRAIGQPHLLAAQHVGGDHVERDERVLQALGGRVPADELAEPRVRHQMAARPDEPERAGHRTDGEHLPAAQAAPYVAQRVRGLHHLGPVGDERPVERTR
jgi:hypothetical protein